MSGSFLPGVIQSNRGRKPKITVFAAVEAKLKLSCQHENPARVSPSGFTCPAPSRLVYLKSAAAMGECWTEAAAVLAQVDDAQR